MKTPVRDLRVGDTWTENGHTRRVTTTPWPVGGGTVAFDTALVPGSAPEHHRLPGGHEVETTR